MALINNYTPEPGILGGGLYGPGPYDINLVLPVPPSLSTSKLHLIPFIPRHIPIALEYPPDLLRFAESRRRDKTASRSQRSVKRVLTPITPSGRARWRVYSSFQKPTRTMLVTEISPTIVLPALKRTHVGSHAVELLLKYVLELPPSGIGFRKVNWTVSPVNVASKNLAKRMGFKLEGVFRWKYVLPVVEGYHKLGKEARTGDAGRGLLGRDSDELALCWDDWEESARELVERAFAREV